MVFCMRFERIKEGEFKRLAQMGVFEGVLAQESSKIANKYHLIGVSFSKQVQYAVRAGRTDALREWRLDNLATLVKSLKLSRMEVRFTDSHKG